MIGGDAIHVLGLVGHPTEKIATAYDNCHLDVKSVDIGKFSRDFMNAGSIDAEALIGRQGFAGEF